VRRRAFGLPHSIDVQMAIRSDNGTALSLRPDLVVPAPCLVWPRKGRELRNHHFDSTVWNDFQFRRDDIVIGSYAKSGTSWVQQIVAQLVFDGADGVNVSEISPWLDFRYPAKTVKLAALEAQKHRRIIKTHLPVDALVYAPSAKYLYVCRDGRDVVWSLHNHHSNANELWYHILNDTPNRVGPPMGRPTTNVREYFLEWLNRDGYPFWPFWQNVRSWWNIRNCPNLLLLHFADLKEDLPGEIRRIGAFLGLFPSDDRLVAIAEHCTFEYMKRHAEKNAPLAGQLWNGGARTFIHKGINGRWHDILTLDDTRHYERLGSEQLGRTCFNWLTEGSKAHAVSLDSAIRGMVVSASMALAGR
jgi:aryl sulfotransferase